MDAGVGIAAVVSIGSKFIERSKFTARHDASCDKEADKTLKLAERFDRIPQEDVDYFEFQEYNMLHSKSMEDLRYYRNVQEEYKVKEWLREPLEKFRTRGKVRHAKRSLQSSNSREEQHLHDLETYSRASSSCGSQVNSCSNSESESGLDLGRHSRPYRTDSCSIRASGGSPPSASLEDICSEEKKAQVVANVSTWLSSTEMDIDSSKSLSSRYQETVDVIPLAAQCYNCHTTAWCLWRKDDEGRTVCNTCESFIKIYDLAKVLETLEQNFVYPSVIEFQKPGSQEIITVRVRRPPGDDDESMSVDSEERWSDGKLAYTRTNEGLHAYSYAMEKLLGKLESVDISRRV